MEYTFKTRCINEQNSFATASFILNTVSGISGSFVKATKVEDCNQAIDGYWNGYAVAIRDRTMTESQFVNYQNDFTIRATGEIQKLVDNHAKAIVYIRRTKDHQLLGYSIISVSRLREYLAGFDITKKKWWKETDGVVSYIDYSTEQEPFFAINLYLLPTIILHHK